MTVMTKEGNTTGEKYSYLGNMLTDDGGGVQNGNKTRILVFRESIL